MGQVAWPRSSAWIVGRELLLFVHLDLRSVAKGQRSKAILRKAEQASPFSRTGHYAFDSDGLVMLWLWDEDVRLASVRDATEEYSVLGSHINNLAVLPETVVQMRGVNGEVLQACSAGTDVQNWRDGVLLSSRWMAGATEESSGFVDAPWSVDTGTFWLSHERLFWRLGLLVLCLVMVFQIGTVLGTGYLDRQLETQISEARQRVAAVAQVRGQARQIQQQNTRLLEQAALPGQLGLLAEFDRLLPESAVFLDWNFQDGHLKVVIEDDELSNRRYLEALAGSAHFADVQVAPGAKSGTALITLEVL